MPASPIGFGEPATTVLCPIIHASDRSLRHQHVSLGNSAQLCTLVVKRRAIGMCDWAIVREACEAGEGQH